MAAEARSTHLIELREVTRSVDLTEDDTLHILRGVSLRVRRGDHLSVVGRSGSGKTTLLNILGLLDTPTSGTVLVDGVEVSSRSERTRDQVRGRRIGFIFQQFNLLPGRTALENVAMPLFYESGRAFWHRKQRASELLERVGLGDRLASLPSQLSGGEQQRVAIARALAREPDIILADEPTGALDVETGQAVIQVLDEIARERDAALVTITHDPYIAALAMRHFRLIEGQLEAVETVASR